MKIFCKAMVARCGSPKRSGGKYSFVPWDTPINFFIMNRMAVVQSSFLAHIVESFAKIPLKERLN
jgi:hypothetical protein